MSFNTKQIIQAIKKTSPKKCTLPILECVHFTGTNIHVTDLGVSTYIPYQTESQAVVNAKDFVKILADMPSHSMKCMEGNKVVFSGNGETIKLTGDEIDNFPMFPKTENMKDFGTLSKEDFPLLNIAKDFVSYDELRPAMCHIFVSQDITATNGHIMYFEESKSKCTPFLMLPKTLEIMKCFNTMDWSVKRVTNNSFSHYIFEGENGVLISQRDCEEKYPDYKGVIPDVDKKVTFDRKEMIKTLKRAKDYADNYGRIGLNINGSITVNAFDIDFGREYEKAIPYTEKIGDDIQIVFNADYLIDTLSIIEDDSVYIETYSPTRAAKINGHYLIMPTRFDN